MGRSGPGERNHDIVIFGASGFVGALTAEYLAQHAPRETRIALAGRSTERLARVRSDLGTPAENWELVVADSGDADAMNRLASSTRVVATTVGPYLKYGAALAQACARSGTHYADLTGEVLFVRQSIDNNHLAAQASGARIVHACGYDSVPSDLGMLVLHAQVDADDNGDLGDTTLVARARGGISGGTVDSMRTVIDAVRSDGQLRRTLLDPYALSPDRAGEPTPDGEADALWAVYDRHLGAWTAPFVMGPFNSRVVRRTNALTGWSYGRGLRYREVMPAGKGPLGAVVGTGVGAALGAFAAGMALPPTRKLLDKVLPKPGSGPSEKTRRNGWFRSEIHTTTSSGARYLATVAGSGDPGYGATAVMFGEVALCLANDRDRLPERAGVLTAATAMSDALVGRLREAGLRLDVALR